MVGIYNKKNKMAKKIMRLTESDLARLVKKIIKEQENKPTLWELLQMEENAVVDFTKQPGFVTVKNASLKIVNEVLEKLGVINDDIAKVEYLTIANCEGADFSNVNLCEFPKLRFVQLKGTPNNLEETQDDCYYNLGPGMFEFNSPD
jgi:hypothetical protein